MQAFYRMETISTLLFAQISGKNSLREIENALLANHKRLYHLGMEAVAKSTLSEAMNRRNPEIFKAQIEFLGQHREPNKKRGVLRDEIIWSAVAAGKSLFPKRETASSERNTVSGKSSFPLLQNYLKTICADVDFSLTIHI